MFIVPSWTVNTPGNFASHRAFAAGQYCRLFASIAAVGEAQGGWENAEIAARLPDRLRGLEPKVVRHGQDEDKHGRIFRAHR